GTPEARKPRMSVSAVIDRIEGRPAGSKVNIGEVGALAAGPSTGARLLSAGSSSVVFSGGTTTAVVSCRTSRLRRDQRDRKVSGSLISPCPSRLVGGAPDCLDLRGRACV